MKAAQTKNVSAVKAKRQGLTREEKTFHLMLLPGMIILLLFVFIPLVGSLMAFQNYVPAKGLLGSKWVGLENYKFIFSLPDGRQVFVNTLVIAFAKLVMNIFVPVTFAILLNEITAKVFKRTFQTIVYLPHFLSWVVLATVVTNMFSLEGPFNAVVTMFGGEPIQFLASNSWFRKVIVGTDVWKEFGYNSVVYLAALTGIDPGLYEAANIDGANRFKQIWHITVPGILPTYVVMFLLAVSNILTNGFDQYFMFYNPLVADRIEVLDYYVYKVGFIINDYPYSITLGMLKSLLSIALLFTANGLSRKIRGDAIV